MPRELFRVCKYIDDVSETARSLAACDQILYTIYKLSDARDTKFDKRHTALYALKSLPLTTIGNVKKSSSISKMRYDKKRKLKVIQRQCHDNKYGG